MDRGNTRRDWDQFGGSGTGGAAYPSGPPDFTKSSGTPDFSRATGGTTDTYSSTQASSGSVMGSTHHDPSQPFDTQINEHPAHPGGIMDTVASVAETAKVATMNAVEGGKNLARQASEGAKNLATGAWEKISSMTGPKP